MTTTPHDALFKAAFGQPDIARSQLGLVLPRAALAHLDLATLEVCAGSFVDDELRPTHTDLLYAVGTTSGRRALVYVVFEHQSSLDATMAFRLLRYMVRVWERWMRDHPDEVRLPVVLPVLLHHGEGRWKAAPDFGAMLDAGPELLEAVRPFQPMFRFVLDDLAALSPEGLAGRALHALGRLVELAFWSSRSLDRLERAAPLMHAITATLVRDARTRALLTQLYVYLWRVAPAEVAVDDIRSILLQVAGPQGAEDVVNAGEQLIERGRAEGETKGLRAAITTALSVRGVPLSELGQARVAACADVALLTQWLGRAVSAATEADVFAGSPGC